MVNYYYLLICLPYVLNLTAEVYLVRRLQVVTVHQQYLRYN